MNKTVKEEIWDKVMINFVGGSYHTRKEVAQATEQIMSLIRGIVDREADKIMYGFPKHYTNTQIMAFQKGIDKLWSSLRERLGER